MSVVTGISGVKCFDERWRWCEAVVCFWQFVEKAFDVGRRGLYCDGGKAFREDRGVTRSALVYSTATRASDEEGPCDFGLL